MANNFYGALALTGGGTGALDKINGSLLGDGDGALVIDATNDNAYLYTLNSSSGAAESSPDVMLIAATEGFTKNLNTMPTSSFSSISSPVLCNKLSV